jgi:hypothetical protein
VRPAVLVVLAACATEPPPPGDPGDDELVVDEQSPPVTHAELVLWLAEGHYLAWACEPEAHPARPPGAHGENRICSNDLLSQSASGRFPIGAASVKELVRDGEVEGFAVMRRITGDAAANAWYWYESVGSNVIADGRSPGICTGCHGGAPRDFIFTRVE